MTGIIVKKLVNTKRLLKKIIAKNIRMLCLEHVKEFNKNWNYFSGMNDDQVINFLKSDMIWHKPTQSFSSSDNFFKVLWNNTLRDELDKDKINVIIIICVNLNLIIKTSKHLVFWGFL